MKVAGFAATGGEAKLLVVGGHVRVNAQIDTRRGRKLVPGDVVDCGGRAAEVLGATTDNAAPRG